jgi:hypothetical protein
MRDYFYDFADETGMLLKLGESSPRIWAEDSDIVRINKNQVRQVEHVHQTEINRDLPRPESKIRKPVDGRAPFCPYQFYTLWVKVKSPLT